MRDGRLALVIAVAVVVGVFALGNGSPRAAGTFAPTITFETSTTRAAAHPDARITIDNSASDEDIENITIDLPDGFWGSLAAAAKCSQADVDSNTCDADSQIGTVINDATVDDSDVRLRGKIFLTEPEAAFVDDDPAGLAIIVPAVVGGVDLGRVTVRARVAVRSENLGPTAPTTAVGTVKGMRTIVTGVPRTIGPNADTDGRTVSFSLNRLVVDLKSNQSGGFEPLLTNPSSCASPSSVSASIESYDSSTATPSDAYQATGCSSLPVDTTAFDFTLSHPNAGDETGIVADINLPEGSPSLFAVNVGLPPMLQLNAPALGAGADQCGSTSVITNKYFDPAGCPAPISPATKSPAVIGKATIETPLVPDPVIGDVYLIQKSPIPWLGIDVSPESDAGNPKGMRLRMLGVSATPKLDSGCDELSSPFGTCPIQIAVQFSNLPDAPVSAIEMDLNLPDRESSVGTISSKLMAVSADADPACQLEDDFTGRFISHANPSVGSARYEVSPEDFTGCTGRDVDFNATASSPVGMVTTDTTPEFEFSAVSDPVDCGIDDFYQGNFETCTSPWAVSALSNGPHRVYVGGSPIEQRAFVVEPAPSAPDVTAPTVTIDSGPTGGAATSDTTPTWTFSSNDATTDFECSMNDGSFLPCDDGASPSGSGSFTLPDQGPEILYAGGSYEFAVRGRDSAGNAGTAAVAEFEVEIAFQPQLTTTLSTTQARAHPDLDVEINSTSGEDLKSAKVSLPDGFFGGLTGVQTLCPLTTAAAGNCTSASQVGTVETEARVDESIVRITGQVYLTDSAHAGEPAGLSIKVPAVIQEIDLGDIIVSGRLQVRGQANGIDSLVVDIPDRIVPNNGFDTETEFDMRRIVLKLRTGAGASHPLLTNPSSCNGGAFVASFTGYGASDHVDSVPFATTGCESLGFSPSLSMSVVDSDSGKPPVNGSSSKPVSADLTATVTASPGETAIRDVSILMPRPLTINVLAIPPACTVAQYADGAGQCPETSRVGSVSAISPLLPEPLTGSIYLLKQSDPARAVPRLLIALRGRINIDIIADNRFENLTQIRTTFSALPDVPLSSFSMKVDRVLSTRNEACTVPADEWSAVGQMVGANGKSVPVNHPLVFGCKPKYSVSYRKRAKKTTLNVTAVGGPVRLRKLVVRLPRAVSPNRRTLRKKLVVSADGKRLSRRCYKVTRSSLTVSLCGRNASTIKASFRAGSLVAGRKAPKRVRSLSIYGVDTANKRVRFSR